MVSILANVDFDSPLAVDVMQSVEINGNVVLTSSGPLVLRGRIR